MDFENLPIYFQCIHIVYFKRYFISNVQQKLKINWSISNETQHSHVFVLYANKSRAMFGYKKKTSKMDEAICPHCHLDTGTVLPQEHEILSIKLITCTKMHSTDPALSYALA
jgi:hypothetical protein